MNYSTDHTIYLQDGSLFIFTKRFKKHSQTLIQAFSQVIDGRSKLGKRHPLSLILVILLSGITAGNTTVKDCHLWALHNKKWLGKYFDLSHGLPDARTVSRTIQKVDVDSLILACLTWKRLLYGLDSSEVASFDGKTMRGVHGQDVIRHIVSLFSHGTHQILGQIGVTQKENEIPAFKRLLLDQSECVYGLLLVGDALHTQKETIEQILEAKADYLLFVKGNQERLYQDLELFFSEGRTDETDFQVAKDCQLTRGRDITTGVETVCDDLSFSDYLQSQGWKGVGVVSKIHRFGTREEIDERTRKKHVKEVDETIYCISSRRLTAQQVLKVVRGHWCIENKLHWEKDYLFLEDRCTLRTGNAPQVMTFLKSLCLSLFNVWQLASPTTAVSNFKNCTTIHHNFLRMSGVM